MQKSFHFCSFHQSEGLNEGISEKSRMLKKGDSFHLLFSAHQE